ncbi:MULTISPECIES: hypothetical protein [Streptomyces]|uniref:hypothetical protein n=1 Tax=Streptomyces TaxID=1883 RepID=UPI002248B825|nr:hypothetical protein [Streptomyces sp. JHD 1]MCX2967755.1 hypothetical protein [Streptomyces sp. JHD 1]
MALKDATSPQSSSAGPVDVERAEAALVEHYPRLVRLGYLLLPPSLSRHRRALTAHALAQRALPRGKAAKEDPPLPGQRGEPDAERGAADAERGASDAERGETDAERGAGAEDSDYAYLRLRVVRGALEATRPARLGPWKLGWVPKARPVLPQVVGLRLFPGAGSADEVALEQALAAVSAAGRAAFVLRGLERLADGDVVRLLDAAGVAEPEEALAEAGGVRTPAGSRDRALLESPEFDACSLRARPTDLMRRRQHGRAALVAVAALGVCGALLGLPGDTWGPDGAAAPVYAQNPAAERALDPGKLVRVEAAAWRNAARTDFTAWPARGDLAGDEELLRRALAVWARPGGEVNVTATPGTHAGPAAGPPHLLYAGEVDGASVVLLYDGLRVVRYAEPQGGAAGPVALDFARVDAAGAEGSSAVLLTRSDGNARYLLAPWVGGLAVTDLLRPGAEATAVKRRADGVTDPVTSPPLGADECTAWPALQVTSAGREDPYLLTDLGELTPALLTHGDPAAEPGAAAGGEARAALARGACHLTSVAAGGVRAVNTWAFATQELPEGNGTARWVCTRAETWRGAGAKALVQFHAPAEDPAAPAALAAQAEDAPACGPRAPRVVSGVLWKSTGDTWYLLAAGSEDVTSITASGDVNATAEGRRLAAEAARGASAELTAKLTGGGTLRPLAR